MGIVEDAQAETEIDWEGCLSIPGIRGEVSRHRYVVVTYIPLNAQPIGKANRRYASKVTNGAGIAMRSIDPAHYQVTRRLRIIDAQSPLVEVSSVSFICNDYFKEQLELEEKRRGGFRIKLLGLLPEMETINRWRLENLYRFRLIDWTIEDQLNQLMRSGCEAAIALTIIGDTQRAEQALDLLHCVSSPYPAVFADLPPRGKEYPRFSKVIVIAEPEPSEDDHLFWFERFSGRDAWDEVRDGWEGKE